MKNIFLEMFLIVHNNFTKLTFFKNMVSIFWEKEENSRIKKKLSADLKLELKLWLSLSKNYQIYIFFLMIDDEQFFNQTVVKQL